MDFSAIFTPGCIQVCIAMIILCLIQCITILVCYVWYIYSTGIFMHQHKSQWHFNYPKEMSCYFSSDQNVYYINSAFLSVLKDLKTYSTSLLCYIWMMYTERKDRAEFWHFEQLSIAGVSKVTVLKMTVYKYTAV